MIDPEMADGPAASANRATTALVARRASFNAAHQLRDRRLSREENQRVFGKCANLQ